MSERLLSVGLDVGTTSTQLIFSELIVENQAGSFSVPEMSIAQRNILYTSPVHFTPLLEGDLVDAAALRHIIENEYEKAGIPRSSVDTGAIIITGETSRKENAEAVLHELSGFAGEFVVATAGPDLESVLAAKGAGADAYSERTGKPVLHMDIGGGTSNLALIRDGKILETGCLNVGGRLIKFDTSSHITYVSPVLRGICPLKVGDTATPARLEEVAQTLVHALEMAAALREPSPLLASLTTSGTGIPFVEPDTVISFSGGVADCIARDISWQEFGDIGPILGQAIRNSRLCKNAYTLGEETIRATVIGAGCHSAQLSGSTVFCRGVQLPVKNLPVAVFTAREQEAEDLDRRIAQRLQQFDSDRVVLALPGSVGGYDRLARLAQKIIAGTRGRPVYVCLEADAAKALGQKLCLGLPEGTPCLCIDRVRLTEDSFLDVGSPVGPAFPVVVKTLVMQNG